MARELTKAKKTNHRIDMHTQTNSAVIQLNGVWKTYPRQVGEKAHTALSNVSFSLQKGHTLGLVGANGAGKSTTLRLLMGLLRPDKGSIEVLGQSPENHLIRHRIGYLPETANFPANLTISDMLRYCGKICRISSGQIAAESEKWLKYLGLWEARKRPLRNYSKGMQQRANFVLALLNDPDLLILDEPMSGLDPFGRADIFELIQALKKQGKTILLCSHILEDVDRLVDKVLVLHEGWNLFEGNLADLITGQNSDSFVDAFKNIVETNKHETEH
jgi:ABC-2 type transport system ATP-binding protein